jgi:hypothetical protein
MEASHLTSYFDEAFFSFIFWQIFLWLHILMKVSLALYFDEGFFGFIFWWTLHTLTSSFNKGFIFSLKTKASHVTSYFDKAFFGFIFWWSFLWLRISTKVFLASYFDKGFFGFVFWWTLHTLTSYFNKGFIFCLKNEGCTNDFVFWWSFLCLRILMKLSLTSYFDEGLFGFVFWQSFLWLHILTKLFLTSYCDEGLFGFVFGRRLRCTTIKIETSVGPMEISFFISFGLTSIDQRLTEVRQWKLPNFRRPWWKLLEEW